MPAALILGYYVMKRPELGKWLAYVYILSGVLCATMILVFFAGKSDSSHALQNINELRAIDYISAYAGIAAAMLFFTLLADVKLFPKAVAFILMLYCFLGQMATLNRSNWLAQFAALIAAIFVTPPGKRMIGAARVLVLLPVLLLVLWGGTYLMSALTNTDFTGRFQQKVDSLLPNSETEVKAWDTRIPGIVRELQLWSQSPIFGRGFGIGDFDFVETGRTNWAYRHNAWTCWLSETGIFGFTANLVMVIATIRLGAKLVRERIDPHFMVVGALGVVVAAYGLVEGMSTMGINILRGAIVLGVACGAVIRARGMQLQVKRLWAGYLPDEMEPAFPVVDPHPPYLTPSHV
jgi:hypothetical protein